MFAQGKPCSLTALLFTPWIKVKPLLEYCVYTEQKLSNADAIGPEESFLIKEVSLLHISYETKLYTSIRVVAAVGPTVPFREVS